MTSISAVIVNFNQDKKLALCLKSIKDFAQEIIVLDLGSEDKSLEVCKKYGAKIIEHEFVPYVEKVRNFAVFEAQSEWVLVLDPDEVLGEKLKNKLKEIASERNFEAVNIPRKNIFFGKWISHTNWWPDKHVRFFRKGQVKWSENIHEYPHSKGKVLELPAKADFAIEHFGYDSISEFIQRQNRYSQIQAQDLYSKGIRFSWFNFFLLPFREFVVRFVRHAGFLDGFYGFALTILMMIYQLNVAIKLWEMGKEE